MNLNQKLVEQFNAYTESVCKMYGIQDAVKPITEGLIAMLEANFAMERLGKYEVDDDLLGNSMSTDEYADGNYDPCASKQLWDLFDEEFASTNGVDAAYQKALDALSAQGVDVSVIPPDNSAYIAAFGVSIEDDESEQPWMGATSCEAGALTESNSFRDQGKYDQKVWLGRPNTADETKTMGRSFDRYGWMERGSKGMGLSGKFGNGLDLKADGIGELDSRNSGLAATGRRMMKRQENEFYNNDIQSQLNDMMATDPTDASIVDDIKQYLGELYNNWNAEQDANGTMGSDADFRKYVEDALSELGIG